jgi:hypothetical protein
MDAVNKKAISITRIGFIMFQPHPESDRSTIWSLTSPLRLRQLDLILPDLLVMSTLFYHSPCLKAVDCI